MDDFGYDTDKTGKQVPVDHEGKHGAYVGKMILTLEKK
jgi:5'-nucleotidase